jgi:adenylate cyclase
LISKNASAAGQEGTMAKEIERKFLVKGDSWRGKAQGKHYRQGYLSTVKERTVRVRTVATRDT